MFEILGILVIIQIVFFVFIGFVKIGRINNPLTYFNIWWGFWFFLSVQGLFGLDILSLDTFLIIYLSNFFLSLGLFLVMKRNNRVIVHKNNINWTLINITQVLLTVILLTYFFKTVLILNSTGLGTGDFRNLYIYGSQSIFGSTTVRFFFINFIKALTIAFFLINISTILINNRSKITKFGLILSSVNLILYSGIMMGRIEVFRLIILYLLSILIYKAFRSSTKELREIKIKVKKRYIIILSLLLVAFTYVRNTSNTFIDSLYNAVEQFFIYFIGPFIAFDKFVKNFSIHEFEMGLGRGFLGGLEILFNNIIGLVHKDNESYATYLARYTDEKIFIGDEQTFNALYTMYFNFYADGKLFTTIVFAFIVGLVIGYVYNYASKNISVYSFSIYLYFAHILIFSSIFWPLDGLGDWMVLIYIVIIHLFAEKILLKNKKTISYKKDSISHLRY